LLSYEQVLAIAVREDTHPPKNVHLTVDILKMEGEPVVSRVRKGKCMLQKKQDGNSRKIGGRSKHCSNSNYVTKCIIEIAIVIVIGIEFPCFQAVFDLFSIPIAISIPIAMPKLELLADPLSLTDYVFFIINR